MSEVAGDDVTHGTISIRIKVASVVLALGREAYFIAHLQETLNRGDKVVLLLHLVQVCPSRIDVVKRCPQLTTALDIKVSDVGELEHPQELLLENLGGVRLQAAIRQELIDFHAADGKRCRRRP